MKKTIWGAHLARNDHTRVYDELLVTALLAGNARAMDRIAARWQPRLLKAAKRLLRDEDQAREAVQETWSGICRGWWRLSDPAKFPVWAYSILRRKCADQIRQAQTGRARLEDIDTAALPVTVPGTETGLAIRQAMARLSPAHRTAASLYFGDGLSLPEIAAVTGVPVGTAKSRLFHARRHLQLILKGDDHD